MYIFINIYIRNKRGFLSNNLKLLGILSILVFTGKIVSGSMIHKGLNELIGCPVESFWESKTS